MNEVNENSFEDLSNKMQNFLDHVKNKNSLGLKEIITIFCSLLPILAGSFGFVYYNVIETKTSVNVELREIKKDISVIENKQCKVEEINSRLVLIEDRVLVLRSDVDKLEEKHSK